MLCDKIHLSWSVIVTNAGSIPGTANAVIHGYLSGPDAGIGVSDILFGHVNPSGRLPFTYPKFQNTPLVYYRKIRQRDYAVEW